MDVRTTRSPGTSLLAVAAIAVLAQSVAFGPVAQARPSPATVRKPVVVAGHRPGPVDIQGSNTFGTIGSLDLSAGSWSIEAKALVVNTTGSGSTVHVTTCRLHAGTDIDAVQVDPVGSGEDDSEQVVVLNLARRFATAGTVRLECAADANTGDLQAEFIRMAAVRAGSFTTGTLSDGFTTSGSGKPVIVSGTLAGPVNVPDNGSPVVLGELPLPTGSWFATAKAFMQSKPGTHSDTFTCELAAEGDFDRIEGAVDSPGEVADRQPFALTVVHTFSGLGGDAILRCTAPNVLPASTLQVRNIVITAVKAGQLTNNPIGGTGSTVGSGIPRIISGFRDGPVDVHGSDTLGTIGSFHLPAGAWDMVAKVYLDQQAGGFADGRCVLTGGTASDEVELKFVGPSTIDHVQPLFLAITNRFGSGGGTVAVKCSSTISNGDIQAKFLKITVMKAGTLTTQSLT